MVLKSKVEHRVLNSTQHNCDFITAKSESEFLLVKCLMTFIHQDLWYGKAVFAKYFQQMQDSYQTDWNFWQDKIKFCRAGGLSVIKLLQKCIAFCQKSQDICQTNWNFLQHPFTRPLYKRISLLSLLLFLRDSHLHFSSIPGTLPVSKSMGDDFYCT